MATETRAPTSGPKLETDSLAMVSQEDDFPPSPRPSPVSFPDFLTGALQSLLSGENHLPRPLPPEFCTALLRTGEVGTVGERGQEEVFSSKGMPKYPLYESIALGLSQWISTGSFPRTLEHMEGIAEDEGKSAKIEAWTQAIRGLGASLMQGCKEVRVQLHCQEPYFSQLKDGKKLVEGRCARDYYTNLQVGDGLLFNRILLLYVKDVKRYNTFQEMLETEGLSNVLPGVVTPAEGVQVYRKFYSEAKEKEAGVVGIHVRHPENQKQPLELLYDLLKVLHVEGLRSLLGMRWTMGSVADALPPPISVLLSSFSVVNNETAS